VRGQCGAGERSEVSMVQVRGQRGVCRSDVNMMQERGQRSAWCRREVRCQRGAGER
jgi:hypothetical protein